MPLGRRRETLFDESGSPYFIDPQSSTSDGCRAGDWFFLQRSGPVSALRRTRRCSWGTNDTLPVDFDLAAALAVAEIARNPASRQLWNART